MDTISWIFVGIIGVALILYFVFTFAKKIILIQNISTSVLCPAIGFLAAHFLLPYIPDSYHTIKLTIVAFIFISITVLVKSFFSDKKTENVKNTKKAAIFEWILFVASITAWIFLYKSVYVIYRIPLWVNIIAISAYAILYFLFFVIFIKKASLSFYIPGIITLISTAFLHYTTLVLLCFDPANYTLIRFIGTTALMAYIIFSLLNNSVINLKLKKLISLMILLASQVLIALSNIMVFY